MFPPDRNTQGLWGLSSLRYLQRGSLFLNFLAARVLQAVSQVRGPVSVISHPFSAPGDGTADNLHLGLPVTSVPATDPASAYF